ncbi:hypothetical protein ACFWF6_13405 [Streptomyces goshikiensis]|uniref:hypothetical protein n=1 Tax=Streptomyces goshikiensis TaxID=1942 RepID=UPI00365780D5
MGIAPQLTDTELVALAMTQAMLGFTSELGGSVTPVLTCGISPHTCPNKCLRTAAGLL